MHSQARGSLLAAEKGAMGETERRSEKAPRYGHSGNVAMCEGRRSMSVDLEKKGRVNQAVADAVSVAAPRDDRGKGVRL